MAQCGGQKNPPWAAQFAATVVSQPGHSGQSLDLNSIHCEFDTLLNTVLCAHWWDKMKVWLRVQCLKETASRTWICLAKFVVEEIQWSTGHSKMLKVLLFLVQPVFLSLHSSRLLYLLTPSSFCIILFRALLSPAALGVQQPSLLGASPSMYSQQSALAAASLNSQSVAANYQLSQQASALQQQAAAAAAAALQQVNYTRISRAVFSLAQCS